MQPVRTQLIKIMEISMLEKLLEEIENAPDELQDCLTKKALMIMQQQDSPEQIYIIGTIGEFMLQCDEIFSKLKSPFIEGFAEIVKRYQEEAIKLKEIMSDIEKAIKEYEESK